MRRETPLAVAQLHLVPVAKRYQSLMDTLPRKAHCYSMELRQEGSATERPLVSVVDDDQSVRESLPDLLGEFGFEARSFSSPEEFLESGYVDYTKCLILDIAMPRMSGPVLQRELRVRGQEIPIIFITASTDMSVRSRLLEQGAVECLFKPFSDTALFDAIRLALHPK